MDWTENERAALAAFVATPGILRSAFEKYVQQRAEEHRASCARYMATVPRDPENAADQAARASELDEFFEVLADVLQTEQV